VYTHNAIFYHQLQAVQTIALLPYHRVMSPQWIKDNAVINGPHTLIPQYFEILPTNGVHHQRALQVQLVAPNILTSTDSITVTVTVAVDTNLPNITDHDFELGISDGTSFIGFIVHDISNYHNLSPCHKLEGDVEQNILKNVKQGKGPLVTTLKYSSEIKMQIKPSEKWSSCHTEHDGGYVNIQNYQPSLDLSKALYFEVYRNHATEKYRIKYIVVDVDLE